MLQRNNIELKLVKKKREKEDLKKARDGQKHTSHDTTNTCKRCFLDLI